MPRQRRGYAGPSRSAPSRPTVAPARPNVPPSQQSSRSASTAAHPPVSTQQSKPGQSPSLFGQIASTAAGVAVGSSIGHALGGFFGGSSQTPGEANGGDATASQAPDATYQSTTYGSSCEVDAKALTRCLDENKNSEYQMSICGWYLEQLKACQSAASQY